MPRITGLERVQAHLTGLAGEETVRRVGQALVAGGEIIRAEAAHLITQHAVSGKGHVPSLPHEPPNEDTGDLRAHLATTQVAPLRVQVIDDSDHAVPLEAGTSKMIERPYMGPATRNKRQEVVDLVLKAVSSVSKGGPTAP